MSLDVKEARWDQLFCGILQNYGLAYTWEGDILRIITLEDINHEIQLMEADQKKKSKLKEYELKIKSLRSKVQMVEPLETRIIHVKYADPEILRDNLWKFLQGRKYN